MLVKGALDLLFPPRCLGCGRRGRWLCPACESSLPRIPSARCRRCATPLVGVSICARCWQDPPKFEAVTTAFLFDGVVREAIHRLKYQRARHLAEPLVGAFLRSVDRLPDADVIVPVPLHPLRLAERGYNQADLLSGRLAEHLSLPIDRMSLTRTRDTPAQVAVVPGERWNNVRGAFAAPPASYVGSRVLLVDDVATTASTLRAAASAAVQAGARKVEALVVARAGTERAQAGTWVASSTE
jgi:ComF family protein